MKPWGRGVGAAGTTLSRYPGGPGGSFFDFGSLFIDKTVRSSPSCDGLR